MNYRGPFNAYILRVIDGDTVEVMIDLDAFHAWTCQRLRLRGINAPKLSTPEGQAALGFLAHYLPPLTQVQIVTFRSGSRDVTSYDRYVADMRLPGTIDTIQGVLLGEGHATLITDDPGIWTWVWGEPGGR